MTRDDSHDDVILSAEGLTKRFGGFVAVDNVSLNVKRGTIHALIGPNGAGKTTCFNLLTKFLPPTSGRVFFKGQDITGLSPAAVANLGMIRSFQISATFGKLTALENVRIALQKRSGVSMNFWSSEDTLETLNGRALELLAHVGLESFAYEVAELLPYGRKRALEVATTLALEPELLLLDEPMAGLGQEDIVQISALIREVSRSRTVVMVEHNLSVVSALSDTITVLARGSVLAEGVYSAIANDPRVVEAYLGKAHG